MGPIETLRDHCGQYYRQLRKEGYTPMDLLSEPFLSNLDRETREAGRNDFYDDSKLHRALRDGVSDALSRKRSAQDRHNCAMWYRDLKRENLNPFDLFNWDFLLNLEEETFQSGRRGWMEDPKLHRVLREAVWAALERKAEDIDMEDGGDDECQTHLKRLKHNRRTSTARI